MSATVTIEEAQSKLKELIHRMAPGEELVITEDQKPVAKLVSESAKQRQPRKPGNCKGMITLLVEDDSSDLVDFIPHAAENKA
jgi:antitoxin (DNA-binding transcriptional repressor) of toxin-antitoxin stability system